MKTLNLGTGPDFTREEKLIAAVGPNVCGVDEVGRGPFAGPVLAAAVILDAQSAAALGDLGMTDSKKISPKRREALAKTLEPWTGPGAVVYALGAASVREIEQLNILGATDLAMRRAVARLPRRPAAALVDGNRAPKQLAERVECVVGGDRKSLCIAAASVVAKVARDRLMRRLAARWPAYGWERNAGYGSAPIHIDAILRHGLTPHHRKGFCAKLLARSARTAQP